MTKLDAVNIVLRGLGRAGVSSLDTDGASDAAQAERVLDAVDIEIQSRGWVFNTRFEVTLSPDGSDHIALPDGCITIDADGSDSWRRVTQVGGRLFDLDNNTDEFEGDLIVTHVSRYEFSCIPHPVQEYIAAKAAVDYNAFYGHPSRAGQLHLDLDRKKGRAFRFDNGVGDVNVLDSVESRRVRGDRYRVRR